ncbi:hypothetical protein F751_1698 [Auxenochlorella protothecoides]|uniref:Uncharacterized protein n=1 Tax=Auxenochlorella protothecoides TaxID=3075 RepID=A0A087SGG5_AUXPR|nr:hypothetical protein F751_1698 [Auxenochlorella protothecoides]KFM24819.1 hypothetical protein F751_1698 [Auxenochlorella protothecoides]
MDVLDTFRIICKLKDMIMTSICCRETLGSISSKTKLELAWRNRERSLEAVRARAARSKHRAAAASERMARQRAALVLRLERKAAAGARAAAAFLRLDLPVIVSPSPSPSLAPGSTALAAAVHVAASSDAPLAAVSARFDRLTAALGKALDGDAASRTATQDPTPTAALPAFDAAWVEYLELFVAWKAADAAALEADLIRIAVELQASAARKREESAARDVRARSAPDMAALEAALQADLALLRERVLQLTGRAGLRRLEAALRATPGEGEAVGGAPGLDGAEGQGRGTTSQPAAAAEEGGEGGVAQTIDAWDVDAFLAQHPNFRLLWQLLHEPTWRLPTEEAEGAWRGAVRAETGPDMASRPVVDAGSGRVDAARLRTIAEAAFWDGLRHDLNKADTAGTAGETARRGVLQRVHAILSEQAAELLDALDPASSLIEVVGAHLSTDKLRTLLGESHATPLHQPLLGLLRWSIQLLPKELHPEAERACASLAGSASESAEPTGTAAPPPNPRR